ncbi:hypothetical protein GCK72_006783 [Caenorhabditis remanei]|uniref:CC domain-containing protein n=1 Tax=Caenorhabditis remanei TaxID=31234 RepID=A0A6A5HH67_CAERE|nr:hypothetical protein GCK72_006783 [Caenorhabditis remanei]KAF1766825.1 hypothetical protein GCK72_006783 [Caenorhabditis remanei]
MFKVLAISALFFVLATEAANPACKKSGDPAIGGACPDGSTLVAGGQNCCEKADVYDADSYFCRDGNSLGPAFGGICPDGFLLVAGDECCDAVDFLAKQK